MKTAEQYYPNHLEQSNPISAHTFRPKNHFCKTPELHTFFTYILHANGNAFGLFSVEVSAPGRLQTGGADSERCRSYNKSEYRGAATANLFRNRKPKAVPILPKSGGVVSEVAESRNKFAQWPNRIRLKCRTDCTVSA